MKLNNTLAASVNVKPGNTAKAFFASTITIYLPQKGKLDVVIATANKGGKWTEGEALKEFAKNPSGFKLTELGEMLVATSRKAA